MTKVSLMPVVPEAKRKVLRCQKYAQYKLWNDQIFDAEASIAIHRMSVSNETIVRTKIGIVT